MHTRWIEVGTVFSRYVTLYQWGVPDGLEIHWRGRSDWNQPHTFIHWDDLFCVLRRRLEFAGLEMITIASSIERTMYGSAVLLALVRRNPAARRRRRFSAPPEVLSPA